MQNLKFGMAKITANIPIRPKAIRSNRLPAKSWPGYMHGLNLSFSKYQADNPPVITQVSVKLVKPNGYCLRQERCYLTSDAYVGTTQFLIPHSPFTTPKQKTSTITVITENKGYGRKPSKQDLEIANTIKELGDGVVVNVETTPTKSRYNPFTWFLRPKQLSV